MVRFPWRSCSASTSRSTCRSTAPPAALAPEGITVVHVLRYGAEGTEGAATAAGPEPSGPSCGITLAGRRSTRRTSWPTGSCTAWSCRVDVPVAANGGLAGRPSVVVARCTGRAAGGRLGGRRGHAGRRRGGEWRPRRSQRSEPRVAGNMSEHERRPADRRHSPTPSSCACRRPRRRRRVRGGAATSGRSGLPDARLAGRCRGRRAGGLAPLGPDRSLDRSSVPRRGSPPSPRDWRSIGSAPSGVVARTTWARGCPSRSSRPPRSPATRTAADPSVAVAARRVARAGFPGRAGHARAPVERVVFVLADVFAVPYAEIAAVVDRSPEACRQVASRARRKVARAAAAVADRVDEGLLGELVGADRDGPTPTTCVELLAPGVVLHQRRWCSSPRSPSAGRAARAGGPAAGQPGGTRLPEGGTVGIEQVNGAPALVIRGGGETLVLPAEREPRQRRDRPPDLVLVNPDKVGPRRRPRTCDADVWTPVFLRASVLERGLGPGGQVDRLELEVLLEPFRVRAPARSPDCL